MMLTYRNNTVLTSVRRLVEFLLRSGDIVTGSGFSMDTEAMQEGSRLHRKIQKAQGAGYRSEVPLKMSWTNTVRDTGEEYELVLEGRADGIDRIHDEEYGPLILIDEIKCVYRDVEEIEEAEPLHLAQAKCYACMYAMCAAEDPPERVAVRITYCSFETEELKYITNILSFSELKEWFYDLIDSYRIWAEYVVTADRALQESIAGLHFPFDFRPGQKQMAAVVYRAVHEGRHLFLQAPTGVGKTISALYPAIQQLKERRTSIFYLTAKTITRTVAEDTLALLARQKLAIHSVTITAKERICIHDEPVCNPETCPLAKGHYDRINAAVYRLLTEQELITREVVLQYAKECQVCPYELAFEAAAFCDCVICDYNYVFDPHVNVRGLFGAGGRKDSILLIDEAHNLLDRARTMYSADLRREELTFIRKRFHGKNPYVVKKTQAVLRKLSAIERIGVSRVDSSIVKNEGKDRDGDGSGQDLISPSDVDSLYFPILNLIDPLFEYLKDHPEFEDREEIVQIFFRLRHFLMITEKLEKGYQIYSDGSRRNYVLHLGCIDPSGCIEEYLEKAGSAVFFSATLLPIHYYRQLLGGSMNIDAYSIPSPFDKEHRLLMLAGDVTSRYSRRGEALYNRIVRYLEIAVSVKEGNYMIFFPSYEMLSACEEAARRSEVLQKCRLLIQSPAMDEEEREHFLESFTADQEGTLVGFCVLGSLFSEGVDLAGDRLIGVLVVGTGLPKVCKEREMIRTYFDMHGKKGYDYAYRYPGMNKVLQAAGRVIRTRRDRGLILLLDDRFLWRENQVLLPGDWDSFYEVSIHNCQEVMEAFWKRQRRQTKG